ncbi:MAG: hypothetical protein MJ171_00635 [Clostridia bacterium]|nr:hypothetical protein [Clostridia bacterium]
MQIKEKTRDILIAVITIFLIIAVLVFLKIRTSGFTKVETPVMLNDSAVCLSENGITYIPFTFLDNITESRYIKEIKIDNVTAQFDRNSLSTGKAPRNYSGSAMYYEQEAYTKPYSLRKLVVEFKGNPAGKKNVEVTMSDGQVINVMMDLSVTSDPEKATCHVNRTITDGLGIEDRLAAALLDKTMYEKSDSGAYRFDKKKISAYVDSIQ